MGQLIDESLKSSLLASGPDNGTIFSKILSYQAQIRFIDEVYMRCTVGYTYSHSC